MAPGVFLSPVGLSSLLPSTLASLNPSPQQPCCLLLQEETKAHRGSVTGPAHTACRKENRTLFDPRMHFLHPNGDHSRGGGKAHVSAGGQQRPNAGVPLTVRRAPDFSLGSACRQRRHSLTGIACFPFRGGAITFYHSGSVLETEFTPRWFK